MTQALFYSSNAVAMTLVNGIGSGDTSCTLSAVTGLPASFPFKLLIGWGTGQQEVIHCTALAGAVATIIRGLDGTTAQVHGIGASVVHGVSALEFNSLAAHIGLAGGVHGLAGNVVGTTDAQTLTNKTLTAPIISTISNTGTLTLPTSTDALVGRATVDTLTNKTLNGSVLDASSTIGGVSGTSLSADRTAWSAWTPSATNVTTSSSAGHFKQVGKSVQATGRIVLSGAPTSVIEVSLPANAALPFGANDFACGEAFFSHAGTKANGTVFLVSDGTNRVYFNVKLDTGFSDVGPTAPWTWASGDAIAFTITYEAA